MLNLKSAVLAAAIALISAPAFAHASFETNEAVIGKAYKGVLRIPHGCGVQATHTVQVDLPSELVAVKPMPKAGWVLETKIGPYASAFNNHGKEMREGVRQIIWSQGNLADEHYDEFVFSGIVAPDSKAGLIHVPVTQRCANGEQSWTEIPTAGQNVHELKSPAPSIRLIQLAQAQSDTSWKIGDITITAPWTRATPKSAPVAGGFVKITNNGQESDWLTGGTFTGAGRVEVHEMATVDGVMRMRQLGSGLEIKPGQTIELKPGGFHLMFMELKQPTVEGKPVRGALTFRKAGTVEIDFTVAPIGAPAPGTSSGHQHHH